VRNANAAGALATAAFDVSGSLRYARTLTERVVVKVSSRPAGIVT
jgi:hypothetical protein